MDGSLQRVTFAKYEGAAKFANKVAEELAKNRAQFVTLRGVEACEYQNALEMLKPVGLSIFQAANVAVENQRLLAGRGTQVEAIRYFVEKRPQQSGRRS